MVQTPIPERKVYLTAPYKAPEARRVQGALFIIQVYPELEKLALFEKIDEIRCYYTEQTADAIIKIMNSGRPKMELNFLLWRLGLELRHISLFTGSAPSNVSRDAWAYKTRKRLITGLTGVYPFHFII